MEQCKRLPRGGAGAIGVGRAKRCKGASFPAMLWGSPKVTAAILEGSESARHGRPLLTGVLIGRLTLQGSESARHGFPRRRPRRTTRSYTAIDMDSQGEGRAGPREARQR